MPDNNNIKNGIFGFGKRLAAIRENAKLSRKDFAERIGLNGDDLVVAWESGSGYPPGDVIAMIAAEFKVDAHEFLTGEPSPAVAVEVEALRKVKHNFRLLLNVVRERTEKLKRMDRGITEVVKAIDKEIGKLSKTKKKGSKGHDEITKK